MCVVYTVMILSWSYIYNVFIPYSKKIKFLMFFNDNNLHMLQ